MLPIAWFPNGPELWVVLLIVVLLFGVKKIPEIGKSMAEGIHEFKKASRKIKEEVEDEDVKPEAKSD
jgi:sec-independent protein translocase protein TatA